MGMVKRRLSRSVRYDLRPLASVPLGNTHTPLVHVTAVGAARQIVDDGQIDMRPCPVFSTSLTYFFVLRPAYRLRDGQSKSDEINRFPFVFFIAPDNLGDPFHVYPFDTGGACEGVFDARADKWVYLEDYELEPSMSAAVGHILWAFDDMSAYLEGNLKQGLSKTLHHWQDVARSFLNIAGLASSGRNQPDRRASAVEVAYHKHVPLKGNVKFAIIPKQYLEAGAAKNIDFMNKLAKAGIDWDVYDWQPNKSPDEFQDEILRISEAYYRGLGVL